MPLVLATGAPTESGHQYGDDLGVVYEYPLRYRRMISAGEVFVYYRGRRRVGGGTQPQVYLGAGVIGAIAPGSQAGLLTCTVVDFRPFETPVPFRRPGGAYLEPGADRRGYFQPGVRRISVDAWEAITSAGLRKQAADQVQISPAAYATSADARLIEALSREAVEAALLRRSDVIHVWQMPLNNPGYDLRAMTDHGDLFVEVKGTRSSIPRFFLSESERRFAHNHYDNYLLAVVVDINLSESSYGAIHELAAPPNPDNASLTAHQWTGVLQPPT